MKTKDWSQFRLAIQKEISRDECSTERKSATKTSTSSDGVAGPPPLGMNESASGGANEGVGSVMDGMTFDDGVNPVTPVVPGEGGGSNKNKNKKNKKNKNKKKGRQ